MSIRVSMFIGDKCFSAIHCLEDSKTGTVMINANGQALRQKNSLC